MTLASNPHEMLTQAAEIINARGQVHGDLENNFQLIADLFSLRSGKDFHPYEVCLLLECVKDARMFANPTNVDNYLDGINYKAFAAMFAKDYISSNSATAGVEYKKRNEFKKAEMSPVNVKAKPTQAKPAPHIDAEELLEQLTSPNTSA